MENFLKTITKPTLLINSKQCKANIAAMKLKADDNNVFLRPHFKTHQSLKIGRLFKKHGIDKITVSSVEMAEFFANDGWEDITIAFPVNLREINKINKLNNKCRLSLLAESKEVIKRLTKEINQTTNLFIKIDTGYQRTGIPAENIKRIKEILDFIALQNNINFQGFLTHEGNSYHAGSKMEIIQIHQASKEKMIILKKRFSEFNPTVSVGSTPTCRLGRDFSNIDEIRPGNFVYFDIMQENLGVCSFEEIAVCVAAPIVAKHKARNEIVIYGGGVHLSKEFIRSENLKIFGVPVKLETNSWSSPLENSYVKSLSQEHGVIKLNSHDFNNFKVGDLIGILPVHSCMTANLLRDSFLIF